MVALRELFLSRFMGVVALGLLSSCGATVSAGIQEPGNQPVQHSPPEPMREAEDVAIAITGKSPDIVFRFWACTLARPLNRISYVDIVRGSQTVCGVESEDENVPAVWKYGESGDGYRIVRCEPLMPGEYGIAMSGGERGRAEFRVAEDGTVTITKGLTCDSMPVEWKQEPNSE